MLETTLTRSRVHRETVAGRWSGVRLHDLFASAATERPEKLAVVDNDVRATYQELSARVDDVALGLLTQGVRPGDVVSMQLPNGVSFIIVMLAVERIGGIVHPIAPIFRQREVGAMLDLARPVALVSPSNFRGFAHMAMARQLADRLLPPRLLVSVDDCPDADLTLTDLADLGRASPHGPEVLDLLAPDPDAVAQLIFTSGTTGEPKGVMHTHNTLIAGAKAMFDAQRVGSEDVFHMASTFAHQTGYLFGARAFAQTGGTGVFQEVWDPVAFVDLVERERITMSCGATPFLTDLLAVPGIEGRDLSSFAVFGCFGAPIPGPVLEDARRRLSVRVMPGWGMTEVNLVTTTHPDDPEGKIISSDGRPMPGTAVRVVDERGAPMTAGEEGDLQCRGSTMFVGYVQGRRFTETSFAEDGWFNTGDRARLDEDGFIRIAGRTKDIIIRGGENVPVKDLEDVLIRHPKIAAVAVVGLPHERLGETGCACVVPAGDTGPTLSELRDHLAQHDMTRHYWPESIHLLDEMPVTASGKVQKYRLRQLVIDAQGPQ